MKRTVAEINERIKKGQAVVLTAEEVVRLVKEKGVRKATAEVDVVTTGTFGPMCSSGAIVNTGHSKPRIKMKKAWFNDVEAYCGLAAVDLSQAATDQASQLSQTATPRAGLADRAGYLEVPSLGNASTS